jgi:hypothetical protein
MTEKRRGAAYHEAGHAVVAWEVCCKVLAIHVNDEGNGRTETECHYGRMSFRDRIALCCAGEVAQAMVDAQTHAMAVADDWGLLDPLLRGLPDDTKKELREAGKLRAHEVLKQYCRNVDRVAAYLMTHDELDGSTFIRLLLGNEPD